MGSVTFLSSGKAQKALGIGYRSRMQRLLPQLSHVYFEARQTERWEVDSEWMATIGQPSVPNGAISR